MEGKIEGRSLDTKIANMHQLYSGIYGRKDKWLSKLGYNPVYERRVTRLIVPLLKQSKVFVDLGASIGYYTFLANQHMENGEIYTFEPDPVRYEELKKGIKKNNGEHNDIQVYPYAVSNIAGAREMYSNKYSKVSTGSLVKDDKVHTDKIKIKTVKLDDFFPNSNAIDLIKMDIEGEELNALIGMRNILKNGKTKIFCEVHKPPLNRQGQKLQDVTDIVSKYGYSIFKIEPQPLLLWLLSFVYPLKPKHIKSIDVSGQYLFIKKEGNKT